MQLVVLWGSGVLLGFQNLYQASGFAGPLEWLNSIAIPVNIVFQLSLVAGFFSLLVRWRRSGSVERLQLKWVAYGVTLVGLTGYLPWTVVLSVAILAVPVGMGVAMLRYRLYDIDLVINRTLVYATLTATLALLYLGGIVVLQQLFVVLTGEKSTLAVVASTLVIAALFTPLRRRIQSFIDRRRYRSKYDAAKTLDAFSSKLRDETELDTLNTELVAVVRATMQPAHAGLWLKEPQHRRDISRDARQVATTRQAADNNI
jgi:cytochrome c oxidase subunit IV